MDITSTYTSAIQISGSSRKWKDMVLMKTILTPIIDHRNRLPMVSVNRRFIPKYGNHSFYIVMSKSNLLSTNQRMFGQDINVVGRLCRIHTSVNASSIPTNDLLALYKGLLRVHKILPFLRVFLQFWPSLTHFLNLCTCIYIQLFYSKIISLFLFASIMGNIALVLFINFYLDFLVFCLHHSSVSLWFRFGCAMLFLLLASYGWRKINFP